MDLEAEERLLEVVAYMRGTKRWGSVGLVWGTPAGLGAGRVGSESSRIATAPWSCPMGDGGTQPFPLGPLDRALAKRHESKLTCKMKPDGHSNLGCQVSDVEGKMLAGA